MSVPAVEAPVPTPPVTPPVAPPVEPPVVETPPVEAPVETPPVVEEKPKMSYEDIEAELARVRAEAANHRVKAREAQDKLAAAKTPEEFEAALNEIRETNAAETHALLVSNVALAHTLPPELAAVLKGATKEELEAHAKVLSKFAPAPGVVHLEGGLTPDDGHDEDSDDPAALAQKYGRGRRKAARA